MSIGSEIKKAFERHQLEKSRTVQQYMTFTLDDLHDIIRSVRFISTFAITGNSFKNGYQWVTVAIGSFNCDIEPSEWKKLSREFEVGFKDYVEYHLLRNSVCHVTNLSDKVMVFAIPVSEYGWNCYYQAVRRSEIKRMQMERKKKLRDSRLKEIYRDSERNR